MKDLEDYLGDPFTRIPVAPPDNTTIDKLQPIRPGISATNATQFTRAGMRIKVANTLGETPNQ